MKTSDKVFLIILGAIGLGGILVFGIKMAIRPDSRPTEGYEFQENAESQKTNIVSEEEIDISRNEVIYKNGAFSPLSITIQNKNTGSCIVSVGNQGSKPLLIRLSPHSEKDDTGSLYPEIPPGESILIDPRYRIPNITFHNHRNPAEEFKVILGEGCTL